MEELPATRQRAISCTQRSWVGPTAVHSRDRLPSIGFPRVSKAYMAHSLRSGCSIGLPTRQPSGVASWTAAQAAARSGSGVPVPGLTKGRPTVPLGTWQAGRPFGTVARWEGDESKAVAAVRDLPAGSGYGGGPIATPVRGSHLMRRLVGPTRSLVGDGSRAGADYRR